MVFRVFERMTACHKGIQSPSEVLLLRRESRVFYPEGESTLSRRNDVWHNSTQLGYTSNKRVTLVAERKRQGDESCQRAETMTYFGWNFGSSSASLQHFNVAFLVLFRFFRPIVMTRPCAHARTFLFTAYCIHTYVHQSPVQQ